MNSDNLESWQKTPVKIVLEAINHANKQNEEDNVIAFLLLDVGAETLLKTYLSLPAKITGTNTPEKERFLITREGFHTVIQGVKDSRQGISGRDLDRVQFFHSIRNKLYHEGNGLTVARGHLDEYIKVIKLLFKQLLKVNFEDLLSDSSNTKEQVILISAMKNKVFGDIKKSQTLKRKLDSLCELAIEAICPGLLMPSYSRKFSNLINKAFSENSGTMIDDEYHDFKCLPNETSKRVQIVKSFEDITEPLIINSKYYNKLNESIEAGEVHHINNVTNIVGVKSIEIERQTVQSVYSIVYQSYFDLKELFNNIIDIVVFQDLNFRFELDWIWFKNSDIYPCFGGETEEQYWESTANTSGGHVEKLTYFIETIEKWLSDQEQN